MEPLAVKGEAEAAAVIPSSLDLQGSNGDSTTTTGPVVQQALHLLPSPTLRASPTPPPTSTRSAEQGSLHFTFVLALLAYVAAVMVGILPDSKDTIAGWSTAPRAVFVVLAMLTVALLAVGFMAAGYHVVRSSGGDLWISASCAKLGAILSSALLVVAISCKLGPWGCVAAAPFASIIACAMAAVWIWGDESVAAEALCGWWRHVVRPHRWVSAEGGGSKV